MLSSLIKSADWKAEKHVPAITAPESVKAGEPFEVEIAVGKEIPHPNTLEHHIAWAALYFVAEGSQLPVELARAEFRAHGPDLFTAPVLKATIALPTPPLPQSTTPPLSTPPLSTPPLPHSPTLPLLSGTLHAVAYCNIHGLWESEMKIAVR